MKIISKNTKNFNKKLIRLEDFMKLSIKNSIYIIVFILLNTALFHNCKENNIDSQLQKNELNYSENIIGKIKQISTIYKQKNKFTNPNLAYVDTNKINKDKAMQMGVADAIGGMLASTTTIGIPVAGPFLVLWGAFAQSALIGDLWEKSHPKSFVAQPQDSSFLFTEGQIGQYHNNLLEKSMKDSNFNIKIVSDTLTNSVYQLFINNNYFSVSNIDSLYHLFRPKLIQNLVLFLSYVDTNAIVFNYTGFINNNNTLSNNEKNIVLTISQSIFDINPDFITQYLFNIENTIKNSTSLSSQEKSNILIYIGVLNSSVRFWLIN